MIQERQIDEAARREVARRLDAIEAEHDVRILFACESGSRAWGFESPDSDYDVRFIYVRHEEWYLSIDIETKRDVIETPIDGLWDVNGWDLRKALRLLRKSNPPLLEWLQSPLIYREDQPVADALRRLISTYFSPPACHYHYLHMARGNDRAYLHGDSVKRKKYFYVLRPLLACRWIERHDPAVPMEFERLVAETGLPDEVVGAIEALLVEKRRVGEMEAGPAIPALGRFIASEFARHDEAGAARRPPRTDIEPLNRLFRDVVRGVR